MLSDISESAITSHPVPELGIDSTLQDLQLSDFQIDAGCLTKRVIDEFERNPLRPGAILTEAGALFGAISRRRFWERMSRPYSLDLFQRRPVRFLYEFVRTELLLLSGTTSVVEAAQLSLQRSPGSLYDPLIVQLAPQTYRLLDAHQLLVAQSHIHQMTLSLLRQSSQQLETANLELQRLASLDALTKVANRRHLNEYLARVWQQAMQLQSPLSLILCDVDFFKRYNDTYGHLAGDECLQQIAQHLRAAVEQAAGLVARYGGEEFAIVLPSMLASAAGELAEQVRDRIVQLAIPHAQSPLDGCVTLSLGVATLTPQSGSRPEALVDAADRALYVAKSTGRNCAIAFESPSKSS